MVNRVIAIDYDKCVGCRTCETVCSAAHCGEINPARSRIRVVRLDPEGSTISVPILCMKCVEAFCKAVCPTSAISDDPTTGARVIDEDRCIGCSACVYACPFGAIAVHRASGCAFNCNQCNGEPACVPLCPREAIRYLDSDEVSIVLRRSSLDSCMAFARGLPPTVGTEDKPAAG